MSEVSNNFLYELIDEDIAEGKVKADEIHTRFPPEPNGYLHIGHCKAMIIDFGTARKYGGKCNLRMDDTNPAKEDTEFVDAIKEDIKWLGFDWEDRFYYGSDYFQKDYELAVGLIKKGLAYVCDLSPEEFRDPKYAGDINKPAGFHCFLRFFHTGDAIFICTGHFQYMPRFDKQRRQRLQTKNQMSAGAEHTAAFLQLFPQ
jgi:glutamyl/glutaminyl-tRNA synthetase